MYAFLDCGDFGCELEYEKRGGGEWVRWEDVRQLRGFLRDTLGDLENASEALEEGSAGVWLALYSFLGKPEDS